MNFPKLAVSLLKWLAFIGRKGTRRGFEAQYKGAPDHDSVGRHGVLSLFAQEGGSRHFTNHILLVFLDSGQDGR